MKFLLAEIQFNRKDGCSKTLDLHYDNIPELTIFNILIAYLVYTLIHFKRRKYILNSLENLVLRYIFKERKICLEE